MQYVEFTEVVDEALLTIGAAGDDEIARNFAKVFIARGALDLGISDESIKVCRLYPKNLIASKPTDLRLYIEMACFDSVGCYIPHTFRAGKKRIYPDTRIYPSAIVAPDADLYRYIPVDVSEDETAFYFGTNATSVAYCDVRYYSYPIGKDGLPMIRQDEVDALIYCVRFKWSLRKNESQSEIAQNREMWMREADRARARKKMISNDQAKTIASEWNSMIPNFNRSRF